MRKLFIAALLVILASVSAAAQQQNTSNGSQNFAGLSFGIGLSFTWDMGDRDRVEEAIIDPNGFVRVTRRNNALARIMLESHYFFTPAKWKDDSGRAKAGWGPFVSLQPGSNEIINALGAGVMFGFRRGDSGESFNIGIGYSVDPSSKVLGAEFVENTAAPLDKDGRPIAVRYTTRDQGGILILTSFTWR